MQPARPSSAWTAQQRADLRTLFDRYGAVVHAAAQVMARREGAPSSDDITVAAFVRLAREGGPGDDGAVLGRLLRFAGRAARPAPTPVAG